MITLVSVGRRRRTSDFVPHLSITVTLILTLADVAVLIYFLNHVASMIQLPVVIAGIAATLAAEIAALDRDARSDVSAEHGPSCEELLSADSRLRRSHSHTAWRLPTGHPYREAGEGRREGARGGSVAFPPRVISWLRVK